MRPFSSLGVTGLLTLAALGLNACSSSSSTATDAATDTATTPDAGSGVDAAKVTVSGIAAPHPFTTNPASDFSQLKVSIVDPVTVIANPNAPGLADRTLDTSAGNCAAGCAWSFDNVDISNISLGLVGIIDDMRTTGRLWVKTGTGAGASDFIAMIKASRAPITGVRLFAVSEATEAAMAAFAAKAIPTDTTIVTGELEKRGFMLGTIVSKLSEGAMPVAGATITTSDTRTTILYPSADFMTNGTSTASHGTFLVVPKLASASPNSIVATWTVGKPAGDTHTWTPLTAGTSPGTAFVLLFAATE
jgi:hypothetical protein